ncbi:MAG TPA: hypothetical protein VEB40_09745 [Flavipsychrobacter sp.]|nr:hypothetical protein [Flavipsychrobacter sp.]
MALLLAVGLTASAQQANADAAVKGSLALELKGSTEAVTANYTVSRAYPDNILLQIRPSAEFKLNARIVDTKGNELMKLPSETVAGRYANSIDVSSLRKGDYFIEFYGDTYRQNYRIPFAKSEVKAVNNTK